MATQVQIRRGTTTEHSTFTGAAGELTVDTTKKTVVVHDGTTAGGAPLLRENGSQNAVTTGTSTAASFIPTGSSVPTNGVYLPAANSVAISTNGANRFQIDSSGNITVDTNTFYVDATNNRVGIGTTSPATLLHIASSSVDPEIRLVRNPGAGNLNSIKSDLYDLSVTSGRNFIINAGGSERAQIDSSGRLLVGTSSANANGGILQLSSGITFPATQSACSDANTLDDYEEGTWTVEIYDASSGGNQSSTTTTGYYTKVGNVVSAHFYVSNIVTTGLTGAGGIHFTLPFVTTTTVATTGACRVSLFAFTSGRTFLSSLTVQNTARVTLLQYGSSVANVGVSVSQITSGSSDAGISITYLV